MGGSFCRVGSGFTVWVAAALHMYRSSGRYENSVGMRILLSRRTVYLVTGSACGEIPARYSGYILSHLPVSYFPKLGLQHPVS